MKHERNKITLIVLVISCLGTILLFMQTIASGSTEASTPGTTKGPYVTASLALGLH